MKLFELIEKDLDDPNGVWSEGIKKEKVLLTCSKKGCPRKRKVEWDKNFPKGTIIVKSKCPWHWDGDFDEEEYFDADRNQLYWTPEDE